MNTGYNSKGHSSTEQFPFAAEVYQPVESAKRYSELDELRAEMRTEVRALRAQVTRVTGGIDLGRELHQVRALLEQLTPASPTAKRGDRVAAFVRARGIDGQAATRLCSAMKDGSDSDLPAKFRSALPDVIAIEPWTEPCEGRRIVAMVGPSGVGKTTTIAKIAARARMNGKSVALVSCDGFRVGAVDQLERYADLLGASFHIAQTATELAAVLEEEDADLVLVDTSGRPPAATAPEAALAARRKKDAPVPVDVLLCMPASIRPHDASRVAMTFATLAPTGVCITKVDETDAPSGIIHGPWAARLPLSLMCTGPCVPEDMSEPTPETIGEAFGLEESSS